MLPFAWELILLSSWVRIPKDLLTNQGTPFMSMLMVDLRQLVQVKHLWTSFYHPQMDGIIKRFNQALKRMLW